MAGGSELASVMVANAGRHSAEISQRQKRRERSFGRGGAQPSEQAGPARAPSSGEDAVRKRLEYSLGRIYPHLDPGQLAARVLSTLRAFRGERRASPAAADDPGEDGVASGRRWSEEDVMLITYGDSVLRRGEAPLSTLSEFLRGPLGDAFSGVHVLPFFPSSSDDGFSVIDYRQVDPELGDWKDLQEISADSTLMVDLVINHVSAKSEWFGQFLRAENPGRDYFLTLQPDADTSTVVRPRSHPLLSSFRTAAGERHVWTTFSEDQIDLDFSNPEVLFEMIDVLLFYLAQGARWVRLDAVGFLWKRLGTPCMHLPETHEVVRLLRTIAEAAEPRAVLITETNVPNSENLSYFGDRNEAHAIYNFSLPPLLLDALIQGRSQHLNSWMTSMPSAPAGCAYFNFVASHDGIGLRPAEGLLSRQDLAALTRTMESFGGHLSMRSLADGSLRPYEINISFYDALQGTVEGRDDHQEDRFLCAQTLMLGLEGIPAIYVHSLLATPNDHRGVERTGRARSINRHRWQADLLLERLADPSSPQARVLSRLAALVRLRRLQPAFHPNAIQSTQYLGDPLFAFCRRSLCGEQILFAVHNLTAKPRALALSSLNLSASGSWTDLISGQEAPDLDGQILLEPYRCLWLSSRPS
ncbi:MAG: sugar phosphorylase [Acidobacteriota bacterium]